MARPSAKTREEARMLFVTGQVTINAELARRFNVKPQTIAHWRKRDGWDDLHLKAEQRAAEKMVEQIATERVSLNVKHFKAWDMVLSQALKRVKKEGDLDWGQIDKLASIVDRVQKGQRCAKEMATMGIREEEARAAHAAELTTLVDVVIQSIKENVKDVETRDEIVDTIRNRLPEEQVAGADESGEKGRH